MTKVPKRTRSFTSREMSPRRALWNSRSFRDLAWTSAETRRALGAVCAGGLVGGGGREEGGRGGVCVGRRGREGAEGRRGGGARSGLT